MADKMTLDKDRLDARIQHIRTKAARELQNTSDYLKEMADIVARGGRVDVVQYAFAQLQDAQHELGRLNALLDLREISLEEDL